MADPVSISREFTTDDEGDLHVRATPREWPYPVEFSANGLKWDDKGLYVSPAPALHPLCGRWDAPVAVSIPDGSEHQAAPVEFAWTNPGTLPAVCSLTFTARVAATPVGDPSQTAGAWSVTFTDAAHPVLEGVSQTLSAAVGPVDAVWQTYVVPPVVCAAGAQFRASVALKVANDTGVALVLGGWTVRGGGFAIEGGH